MSPHTSPTDRPSSTAAKATTAAGTPAQTALRDNRFFTPAVISLVMLSFMLGMSEFIVVGILPDISAGLNVSLTTAGGLVSLFAFVYAPATPIGAALASRFERFKALAALTVVFLLGNILCAVAPNYAVFLVARILIALVSGTAVSTSMTFVGDVATPKNRTKFVAWVFSGFSVAAVFGVPAGTAIANAMGWRWAFYVIVALTIALLAAMFKVLPKNHYNPRSRFLAQFFIFTEARIWAGILAVLCGAAATYVFYTYLSPILQDEIGIPAAWVSIALSAYGLMCLASNLYSGKLGDRGRGVKPLIGVLPIYVVHAVLLALLPFAVLNPITGCALLLVLGFFMYLQNTPSQVLYMDVAAETHPGSLNLASSFNSMAFNIGIAVGSAVGSLVTDTVGMHWLGPFGAIFALLAAASVFWLKLDDRKRAAASK